jgi:hypothetical protein
MSITVSNSGVGWAFKAQQLPIAHRTGLRALPGAASNTYLKALTSRREVTHAVCMSGKACAPDRQYGEIVAPTSPAEAPAASPVAGRSSARRGRLALGWEPPSDIDRAGWLAAGTSLAEFGRVNNWWLGDWIRFGTARWGEKYVEAAKITGLDGKTLRNIAYVASRFDLSRRRDNLTWTHHAEVAALPSEQQEEWLERALTQRMSPGDLRLEVRSTTRAVRSESDAGGMSKKQVSTVSCPHCGREIVVADIRSLSERELGEVCGK